MSNEDFSTLVESIPQTEYGSQQTYTNGKVTFEFFPEGFIALNKELATGLHPKVEAQLAKLENDVDIRLSALAAYVGIALDGTYTLPERDKLCFIIAGRLEVLREFPSPQIILN